MTVLAGIAGGLGHLIHGPLHFLLRTQFICSRVKTAHLGPLDIAELNCKPEAEPDYTTDQSNERDMLNLTTG